MASGIETTDFINSALVDFGVTVDITPVSKVLLTDGTEDLSDSAIVQIQAVLNPNINQYTQEKLGLQKSTSAYLMCAPTETIIKNYKVTYDSITWRVTRVIKRSVPANIDVYLFCELELVE